MHGAMKRHEIQVLRRAGQTLRQIAAQAGVSISTIKRILKEPPVEQASHAELVASRGVGRPSKSERFRDLIARIRSARE